MASQDPSTAYTASPEKPKSWFPSFSLPKLPDFFGTGATSAAPAPAAPATAVAEQSSVQPGGRRRRGRKMSKKAGRRTRRRGGNDGPSYVSATPGDYKEMATGPKFDFPPTQVRKGKGGRRTRRVKSILAVK